MTPKDRQIRKDVLRHYYKAFLDNPRSPASLEFDDDRFTAYEDKDVMYMLNRMAGNLLDESNHWSPRQPFARLASRGIEALSEMGESTILDDDTRYEVLGVLNEADREQPGHGRVGRTDLISKLDAGESVVDANIFYLRDKGMVELLTTHGATFHSAQIRNRGTDAYEAFQEHGGPMSSPVSGHDHLQYTFRRGEQEAARRLFGEITELARAEIILIDAYAKPPVLEMLDRVPDDVHVNILTRESGITDDYPQKLSATREDLNVKVRYTAWGRWDEHSRYLIVDREEGWSWGHSFKDSGGKGHTVNLLQPVNRDTILDQFQGKWEAATEVEPDA